MVHHQLTWVIIHASYDVWPMWTDMHVNGGNAKAHTRTPTSDGPWTRLYVRVRAQTCTVYKGTVQTRSVRLIASFIHYYTLLLG